MFQMIVDSTESEVRIVIRFLNAMNVKPNEIDRQPVGIYGEKVMTITKWVRQLIDALTNVHDESQSIGPSVVNSGVVAIGYAKSFENRR